MPALVTLACVAVTVAAYALGRYVFLRTGSALLNPVVLATAIIMAVLVLTGFRLDDYQPAQELLTFLLGPATVALALPLHRAGGLLRRNAWRYLAAIAAGSAATVVAVAAVATLVRLPRAIVLSMAPKSVTAPIALDVGRIIGGDPALAVAFAVVTGMIGASIGPTILTWARVRHPAARGLALGTTAHGQGTAMALQEGEVQGAMAGAAMAIAAIMTSFAAPWLIPWLLP